MGRETGFSLAERRVPEMALSMVLDSSWETKMEWRKVEQTGENHIF